MNFGSRFLEMRTESQSQSTDFKSLIQTIQFLNKNTLPHYRSAKDYSRDITIFMERLESAKFEIIAFLKDDLGYTNDAAETDWRESLDLKSSLISHSTYVPSTTIPEGLVAIFGSWSSPVFRFLNHVVPALIDEGSVLLYCEPEVSRIYARLCELTQGLSFAENRIALLPIDDPNVLEILLDHPSIHGIQGQMHLYQAPFYRSRPLSPEKLYDLHFGAHNPLLFMNDGDLNRIPQLLAESLQFHRRSEIRFNRWFVQEKIFPEVLKAMEAYIASIDIHSFGSIKVKSYQKALANQEPELKSTRHWLLPATSPVNVCTDFSNCSPLHQTELLGPLVTVTRFKNGPEATKFAGTTNYANATSIISESYEKSTDLAALQSTPYVFWNRLPHVFDKKLDSGVRHCSLKTASRISSQIREWDRKS